MNQWENIIIWFTQIILHKLLINTLTLIVLLVTGKNLANELISGTIYWIESVFTICVISRYYFFNVLSWTGVDVSLPLVFVKALHQSSVVDVNSLALLRIKFFHVLVGILSILWVLIILLLLHLEFPGTFGCHHFWA